MSNKQLPLFKDEYILPTGKYHISFSEISDFLECSYRHKLKHIDKLDPFTGSIHTAFGNAIHTALEQYLMTGLTPSVEECEKDFKDRLEKFLFTSQSVTAEDAEGFISEIPGILEQAPKFLDETFPGWKLVSAEQFLFEKIIGQENKWFKGFIDAAIKVPKKRKKGYTGPIEYNYILLDWKTTNWGWRAEQKRSPIKQMQLILYKKFWCQKTGIDPKSVKTGWVLLKRTPKKDGSRIELIFVSAGQKALEKVDLQLKTAINQIKSRRVSKNKRSCMWCSFSGTKYCP